MAAEDFSNIRAQFVAISGRANAVAQRLGPDLLAIRPRPEAWSAAECLMHLQLTATAYLPIWHTAVRRAQDAGLAVSSAPFKLDLLGRFFVWFLDPPPKVRFSAPGGFEPQRDDGLNHHALPAFLDSQEAIVNTIAMSEGLPLDQIIIPSAFTKHIRYNLWSSFCANAAHHRRHVWQAERVADALGR